VNKIKNSQELEKLRKSILHEKYSERPCIIISEKSTCCYLSGSKEVVQAFKDGLKNFDLSNEIDIKTTGCLGFCEIEPIVILEPQGIVYQKVKREDVLEIITETLLNDIIIDRLLYIDPVKGKKCKTEDSMPFSKKHSRFVLGALSEVTVTHLYSGLQCVIR